MLSELIYTMPPKLRQRRRTKGWAQVSDCGIWLHLATIVRCVRSRYRSPLLAIGENPGSRSRQFAGVQKCDHADDLAAGHLQVPGIGVFVRFSGPSGSLNRRERSESQ